jgi:hypothetical protein
MDDRRPSTTDELASLRQLLKAFESGQMKIISVNVDVTPEKAAGLRRDIAFLEKVLSRLRSGAGNA